MSNRIAQWLDRSTGGGILDFSHPLIPEAAQGNYMVIATTDQDEQISHSFEIKEYGLPKIHGIYQNTIDLWKVSHIRFLILCSFPAPCFSFAKI